MRGPKALGIHEGDTVECYDREGFKRNFQGIVQKKTENSVLVYITSYAEVDDYKVREMGCKIYVSLRRVRKVS